MMQMLLQPTLRRAWSGLSRSVATWNSMWTRFRYWSNASVSIGPDCSFGPQVTLRATDGGAIKIGARSSFGRGVQLIAQTGRLVVGDDVHIGDGSIVVCKNSVVVGGDCLIAEYVVIRDQDHDTRTRPIRISGFLTGPIHIGRDVWIGAKATVLRGSTIGDGAVIGAHALVKGNIPAGALAVGVPAKVVRSAEARE